MVMVKMFGKEVDEVLLIFYAMILTPIIFTIIVVLTNWSAYT